MAYFCRFRRKGLIVSHAERRRNPQCYPEVCDTCIPQRRFRLPPHKHQHDRDKHGIYRQTSVECMTTSLSDLQISSQCTCTYMVSPPAGDLDRRMTQAEFNAYVDADVLPDYEFNAHCSAVVDRLVHFLQNNVPHELRPQEVIKAGSLGKGTAVKNKSDADLVIFLSNSRYSSMDKMISAMPTVLEMHRRYLRDYGECEVTGTTQFAVKVKLSCHSGHSLDVDILPTYNVLKSKDFRDVISEMKDRSESQRKYYSAPLVMLQKGFVRNRTRVTKLKTLIQIVKYWRKTSFTETGFRRLPSSYPLELITIGEWEDAGRPSDFDLRRGFYSVLKALKDYKAFRRSWTDNYRTFTSPTGPFVMDPANPFNNVMAASDSWVEVAERAQRTISSGFSDLTGISSWL